ncbi:hypothetical protein A4A49_64393, partial [Nicotiana attenuata]
WIKVNIDGSSFNDGRTGAGGIVRDHEAKLVMAFSQQLDIETNNYSEAKAAWFEVHWCLSNGYFNIILECDSMLIIHMLQGKTNIPWHLQPIVKQVKKMVEQGNNNIKFSHCFREGNQVADVMAK